ncbi:hypothetical protein CAPTEDRAFT_160407 [Capitella teleta]|uniref:Flavin-containing monooxygenase n=1 Tax=Capitella teleta TaxID=283909 RepID=R7TZL7_CAPTE|nr:hypothetical protein CAPTEDRAFT_160407 [Capitella teleta]|eukprot:ELT99393.1 hypothetical protein CAPTEDRAFT_160407 [Capitella teleta]
MASSDTTKIDALVIGAGISGLAAIKSMRDAGFDVLAVERTGDVGGLWHYKEKAYGVMKFTYINVSKHNYCFSDYPMPSELPDYVHNEDMQAYIRSYVQHFELHSHIHFLTQVNSVQKKDGVYEVVTEAVEEDSQGVITPTGKTRVYECKYLAICTGHHAKPRMPSFPGLDTFKGKAYHSVDYNDAVYNDIIEKKVVVIGVGNSAIDVACNAASVGRCKPVVLSTRSGTWVAPNYIAGYPIDHYACRLFMMLPWRVATYIVESVFCAMQGNPKKWKLNPKMHAMQTQPTVSPTVIHHIQRKEIKVVPNVQKIDGNRVVFEDGSSAEADHLILCTGYKVDLPYLPKEMKDGIIDENNNDIKLYKGVFGPDEDHTLAFIGFIQPASGGLTAMSEIQARWWAELCKGSVKLPPKPDMKESVSKELALSQSRWFKSERHTIQRDPLVYCDEIATFFGARPEFRKHPGLAWRLLLGCGGNYQYRLQGPNQWHHAEENVKKVPVTEMMLYGFVFSVGLLLWLAYCFVYFIMDHVLVDED